MQGFIVPFNPAVSDFHWRAVARRVRAAYGPRFGAPIRLTQRFNRDPLAHAHLSSHLRSRSDGLSPQSPRDEADQGAPAAIAASAPGAAEDASTPSVPSAGASSILPPLAIHYIRHSVLPKGMSSALAIETGVKHPGTLEHLLKGIAWSIAQCQWPVLASAQQHARWARRVGIAALVERGREAHVLELAVQEAERQAAKAAKATAKRAAAATSTSGQQGVQRGEVPLA